MALGWLDLLRGRAARRAALGGSDEAAQHQIGNLSHIPGFAELQGLSFLKNSPGRPSLARSRADIASACSVSEETSL